MNSSRGSCQYDNIRGLGYSLLVVGLYAVCEWCEIGSGDGEIPRQAMDHLPFHQADIAELVESLAERGLTVKLIY